MCQKRTKKAAARPARSAQPKRSTRSIRMKSARRVVRRETRPDAERTPPRQPERAPSRQPERAPLPQTAPAAAWQPEQTSWWIGGPAIAVTVMCVVGAGLLVAARGPVQSLDQSIADATSRTTAASAAATLPPITRVETSKAPAVAKSSPAPEPKPAADKPQPAVSTLVTPKPAAPALVAAAPVTASRETASHEPAEAKPTTELVAKADSPRTTPVTITGCLEASDDSYRLTSTDAPKSRSWRSGFLVKRAAAIELVDPANMLKLPNYVGHRVAATGMLVNREMEVRSVQRLAANSCKSQI